jgi:hypothetical protein
MYESQLKLASTSRNKGTYESLKFAVQAMMAASLKAWLKRFPEEELLIEEVGVIAGGGDGRRKGQQLHSDVNAPEAFGLGALTPAPLPKVFKESKGDRNNLLVAARTALNVKADAGLSPSNPLGPEEARYFGARLLTMPKVAMTEGLEQPFQTTDPQDPKRAHDALAQVGDVVLIPGGTPHHGPPSDIEILRVFWILRRYGTMSPYTGYSQIMVCETELFYACISPNQDSLYQAWLRQMEAYADLYVFHACLIRSCKVSEILT